MFVPDSILSDLSSPALARAVKENLYHFFHFLSRSGITEVDQAPGWQRWRTPIAHPWFNGVLCRRPPVEGDEIFVEQTLAFFRNSGTPAITWWLDPDLAPATWGTLLQAHGLLFDDSVPGMAMSLDQLPPALPRPEGLEIVTVDSDALLRSWIDVFAEGYPIPEAMKAPFLDLLSDLGLDLPLRNYLGFLEGVPVATSNLYLGAGVAGIMFVATLPAARGRGVGAAMTLAPLYEARKLGYRAGILQSSEMGYPVYRRLGFQQLTAMEHYYWQR